MKPGAPMKRTALGARSDRRAEKMEKLGARGAAYDEVHRFACALCSKGPTDPAHLKRVGKGYGDWEWNEERSCWEFMVSPLCRPHHDRLDGNVVNWRRFSERELAKISSAARSVGIWWAREVGVELASREHPYDQWRALGGPGRLGHRRLMAWPRLSERPQVPGLCCWCGASDLFDVLERWEEHDDRDRPTGVAIEVCARCVERGVIEKHPRLYRQIEAMEPFPGSMKICTGCVHMDGVNCGNPLTKRNGGAGVLVKFEQPIVAHVNRGRGRGGMLTLWRSHPTECSGRAVVKVAP